MLVGFTNSYWANDHNNQKSTLSYVFRLISVPVTWACKKQRALSLSLEEVEYQAAVNSIQEDL